MSKKNLKDREKELEEKAGKSFIGFEEKVSGNKKWWILTIAAAVVITAILVVVLVVTKSI